MGDVDGSRKKSSGGGKPGGTKRVKPVKGAKEGKPARPAKRGGRVVLVAAERPVANDELRITKQNAKRKRAPKRSPTAKRRGVTNSELPITHKGKTRRASPIPGKRQSSIVPRQSASAAETVERELAAVAVDKLARRETPTARELEALARVERRDEEEQRWRHYRTIPKKHWRRMSGRQAKVLNEQATRHGIPLGGPTISLAEVVRWLHDFLAANKVRLACAEDDDTDPVRVAERRAKLAEAQAREMRALLLVSRAVSTEQHERAIDLLCGVFRTALVGAAGELSASLAGKSVAVVRQRLNDWANATSDRYFGKPE